ncbi:DUF3072 domain-containing protein [Frondihabitans cladoniiphilus]|uniref:DUF3072 family protein n=1 Tax=Frondihabitans cladoniiphilus TaxID=715785 RepID=A0ABP8VK78_9MICO
MSDQNQTPDSTDVDTTGTTDPTQKPMLGSPVAEGETAEKDPSDWVTGDEPATGPQKSYLDTLAREAGEEIPADITKAEASEHIDRLQQKTGRGA